MWIILGREDFYTELLIKKKKKKKKKKKIKKEELITFNNFFKLKF